MKKLVILFVFFLMPLNLSSQLEQHEVTVRNVIVPVRVYDKNNFVKDLNIDDFELYEDGVLQIIEALHLTNRTQLSRAEGARGFIPQVSRNFYLLFQLIDYNRAIAFERLGDPSSALEDYTKAIEIRTDYAEAYNNSGCLMMFERDYEEAVKDFTRAIQIKPGYALAFENRGKSWMELQEYRQAIKDFEKVIELDPNRKEKALEQIEFCESKIKD